MTELRLCVTRTINAPIEAVFSAWLDPTMLAQFIIPGDGMAVPKAEANAVEGGRFDIVMQSGDKQFPHGGEYLKLVPHTLIEFTWESPFSIDGSKVTINLRPAGAATDIELIHVNFPDEETRSSHEGGWSVILKHLEQVLSA